MTLKEYIIKYMTDKGLFDDDARAIWFDASKGNALRTHQDAWEKPEIGYSNSVKEVIISVIDVYVLSWIDENYPQAWYRKAFLC